MDIGIIPLEEEKPKAVPKFLYYVEFTCYNQKCKDFFFLENSKKILPALFDLTSCRTTVVHFCAEFAPILPDSETKEILHSNTDIHVITYAYYNEYKTYISFNIDPDKAWGEAKKNINIHIEKLDCTRYKLLRQERKAFVQPFKLKLQYFKSEFFKKV